MKPKNIVYIPPLIFILKQLIVLTLLINLIGISPLYRLRPEAKAENYPAKAKAKNSRAKTEAADHLAGAETQAVETRKKAGDYLAGAEIKASASQKKADYYQALNEKFILPGDKLYIRLEEDKDYGDLFTITPTGYIVLPLINEIYAVGWRPSALAQKIKVDLEKKFFRKATVSVFYHEKKLLPDNETITSYINAIDTETIDAKTTTEKIYIVGEVSRPGAMNIPGDETFTVCKAIIIAGGFTQFAKQKKVKLARFDNKGKRGITIINTDNIFKKGHLEKDIVLENGDWIIVPQSFFKF